METSGLTSIVGGGDLNGTKLYSVDCGDEGARGGQQEVSLRMNRLSLATNEWGLGETKVVQRKGVDPCEDAVRKRG